jgi:hypothetical protein
MPSMADHCENTAIAVAASGNVEQFVIGYTGKSASIRAGAYRGVGFKHLVILADKLTEADALKLEGELQARLKANEKYHYEKKSAGHSPSVGGVGRENATLLQHSVYIAWF